VSELNEHGQPVGPVVDGWTPRLAPGPVRLAGRYVTLEPLGPEHAVDLYGALGDPASDPLWTYRTTSRPGSPAEMAEQIAALQDAVGVVPFAVVPTGGTAAGITTLTRIDVATGQVEVGGVLYARSLQRTPATTEATHLLMAHAFDDLGYRRFEWKCDHLNEPSRRAALRLGFTYEGRFRNHLIVKGRVRHTDWFSLTCEDWPDVRAAHLRWLDPANFDEHGRQRRPLTVAPHTTP